PICQHFVGGDEELEEIVGIGKQLDASLYQVCCDSELRTVVIDWEICVLGQVVAQAEGELFWVEQTNVVGVDSFQLLLVKACGVAQHVLDVEVGNQVIDGEDIFIGRQRPAQQREVIEHAL